MGFLSPWHILLVLIVALLLFGNRLPEVARSLGKAVTEFKRGLHDVQKEFDRDDVDDEPPPRKLRSPAEDEDLPKSETRAREPEVERRDSADKPE